MSPVDYGVLLIALTLYVAGLAVLGVGARLWADAAAAVHRSRAHGVQADLERETIEHARAAADRAIGYGGAAPATGEEIRRSLLEQRMAERGNGATEEYEEHTTSGEVTPDELNLHMQGGEYRT